MAKKEQTKQQISYAQKVAKPAPAIETVRIAAVISESIFLCLSQFLPQLDRPEVHKTVNGVVSSIYKRPVSSDQSTHISSI